MSELLFSLEAPPGNGNGSAPQARGTTRRYRPAVQQRGLIGEEATRNRSVAAYASSWEKARDALYGEQVYRGYPWAYAAITRIARDISRLPLRVLPENEPDADPIERGPLFDLLARPNPLYSINRLVQLAVIHLHTGGNGLWLMDSGGSGTLEGTGTVRELWPLNPKYTEPIADAEDVLAGYLWRPQLVSGIPIARASVCHALFPDPADLLWGMSPLRPLFVTIGGAQAAAKWNQQFFENDATPGSTVFSTPEMLDDAAYDRLKNQIRGKFTGNGRKNWDWLLLDGDLKVSPFHHSHKEMGFEGLARLSREEVLGALQVPPAIAGDYKQANFAQVEMQKETYWTGTVLPILRLLSDAINLALVSRVQPGVMVKFDTSGVKVLQPDMLADARLDDMLLSTGQRTPNELREESGREKFDGGDRHYLRAGLIAIRGESEERQPAPPPDLGANIERLVRKAYSATRDAKWKAFDDRLLKHEYTLQRKWRGVLRQLVAIIDSKVRQAPPQNRSVKRGTEERVGVGLPLPAHEYLPDAAAFELELQSIFAPVYQTIIRDFGLQAVREISATIAFDSGAPGVLQLVNRNSARIGEATASLLADAQSILEAGLNEGETIRQLMGRLQDKIEGIDGPTRAERIARTEALAAANSGKFEGYRQAGVRQHEWLSSRDERVRESHALADGQVVELGDPFNVGGFPLAYPGDPDGPPGEIVNCRCTTAALPEIDTGGDAT